MDRSRVKHIIGVLKSYILYSWTLGSWGRRSEIDRPLKLDGRKNIHIGSHVYVGYKTWLAAIPHTGLEAKLEISDFCTIGNFNHIYATGNITIEPSVLTADRVYISDNVHGYEDPVAPIKCQLIKQKSSGEGVTIGEGSWIGENVCIIGASIGKHCVIGANSTVTHDIPDYCVAVGSPAKVIKRYDFEQKRWIKA